MERNRTAAIPAFLKWLDRDDQTAPFRTFATAAETGDSSHVKAAMETLQRNFQGRNFHRLAHTWRANLLVWLEACALTLQSNDDPALRELLDVFVNGIVQAHRSQEFLDLYYGPAYEYSYQLATPGHLIQAAIAHQRATGDDRFLKCAMPVADDICGKFRGEMFAEHPCIEMALVELCRVTGEDRYLRVARHFLEPLLRQPPVIGPDFGEGDWRHFNRHVVRQTYLCAGGADYIAETGDAALGKQLDLIWNDMAGGKLLITGQLAVDPVCPERITRSAFELSTGVFGVLRGTGDCGCELCEAVGNMFWNWRMLALRGQAQYMDLFEKTLYNGLLAHIALDGARFFYLCPLASDGDQPPRTIWGHPETSCCPPNAMRLLAALPGYFFSTSADGVWVHLYDNCRLDWHLDDGLGITLVQETEYPWDGKVTIRVAPQRPATFDVYVRIPGWCENANVQVNGEAAIGAAPPATYCRIRRHWQRGEEITLELPMPVLNVVADSRVRDYRNKVALQRGPLVYCFEGVDNPQVDVCDIRRKADLALADEHQAPQALYEVAGVASEFEVAFRPDLLDGIVTLNQTPAKQGTTLTAIPYFAWSNRGPSPMRTWVGRDLAANAPGSR